MRKPSQIAKIVKRYLSLEDNALCFAAITAHSKDAITDEERVVFIDDVVWPLLVIRPDDVRWCTERHMVVDDWLKANSPEFVAWRNTLLGGKEVKAHQSKPKAYMDAYPAAMLDYRKRWLDHIIKTLKEEGR